MVQNKSSQLGVSRVDADIGHICAAFPQAVGILSNGDDSSSAVINRKTLVMTAACRRKQSSDQRQDPGDAKACLRYGLITSDVSGSHALCKNKFGLPIEGA
jgi:hypothetical protein